MAHEQFWDVDEGRLYVFTGDVWEEVKKLIIEYHYNERGYLDDPKVIEWCCEKMEVYYHGWSPSFDGGIHVTHNKSGEEPYVHIDGADLDFDPIKYCPFCGGKIEFINKK